MALGAIEWIKAQLCESSDPGGFNAFPARKGSRDAVLREAIARAEKGQVNADIDGNVIKQRIARPGHGKSKGYRTIILFRRGTSSGSRAFFVYGFAKSQRTNIDDAEKEQFKEAAKYVLALTEKQLTGLLKRGDFTEVKANEQEAS